MKQRAVFWTVLVSAVLLLGGCDAAHPPSSSRLQATDGRTYNFPADLRGRIVIVSFIYTHCPDICRMTIGHLLDLWERVGGDTNVVFATVTLDPARDTVAALRQYAEVWGIPSVRWLLLTGTIAEVERVHKAFGIVARKSYTERLPTGESVYFIDHTDAVFLLDRNGIVRDRREGSSLDVRKYAQMVQQYIRGQ
ncbi:MAG: SCO family protein [Bacteroidota bacterium]|nr:SCO family protein [Candidatus Kapabacteria bacterium]MCS7302748.1 SCO family protein [Candidatus Kapabacteria bacterium]MCX7937235.1 SCO family protein [Chlorobiota bacterium]MDW8075752.1 SCO family protein [Bacteroidota bacterium]MDW8272498.1 SCO family protein [Bacteroidota bacterium]